jgi:spore coat polysaccharide biosynthesis protein SpsF
MIHRSNGRISISSLPLSRAAQISPYSEPRVTAAQGALTAFLKDHAGGEDMSDVARRRVVLILQARMGSIRLPGKSMFPLAGRPLIHRILERIQSCREIDQVVLAIPDTAENEPLAEVASHLDVSVFRGSESNCLDRYYRAAQAYDADIVGRLPADNVCPEASEIDRIARHHRQLPSLGFSSNLAQVFGNGYPDGIGAEMFDFDLLERAWKGGASEQQREHVHLNFFDYGTQKATNPIECPVTTIACPQAFARPDIVLDVNTPEQYRLMARLYMDLYPSNPNFTILDVLRWWDEQRLDSPEGTPE